MDDTTGTLGLDTGTLGPDSLTGMASTVSAGVFDGGDVEDFFSGPRPVDLSFLAPSSRVGSLGRIGEYEIFGVLGRGAMGIVLKGYDRALNRVVAVKVQDPSLALNRRARARFLKEARAVAAINDVNVVTIYKVNVVQDRPYLAMEYVAGSLRERIKAGEEFELVEVLRIALQVAQGLAAAHEQGLLHRDIKPANILLESGAVRVKISDFGLALEGLGAEVAVTPEKVVGTPAYMSPEQVRGERMDARSDLFSLGCVTYAMLAGGSPFGRSTPIETIHAVCEHHPEPPPEADHPLARPLNDLVMRLLAKCPDDRPRSAEEVASELRALLAEANQAGSGSREALAPPPAPAPRGRPARPAWIWPSLTLSSLGVAALSYGLIWYLPILGGGAGSLFNGLVATRPATAHSWTVGRSEPADFPDLAKALEKVTPGSTLSLIDPATYEGSIVLDDPERFRDLTIEGVPGATLEATEADAIVEIRGVPGVTLRGLTMSTRENQFAVTITGKAEGATLDRLTMTSPTHSRWTQVFIHGGATGTAERPIVVANSAFEVGQGGVTIQADTDDDVGFVQVIDSQFLGNDEYVHILKKVHDITIRGNRFVGGQPLTLNLDSWDARRVLVVNNTFLRAEAWLHPADSDPNQEAVIVCNNAILESNTIDAGNRDLSRMARGKWIFHHNLWEPGPDAIAPRADNPLAEPRPRLEVVSRDPTHAGFLRPAPGSALAGAGCGGDHATYVGALAPATVESAGPSSPVAPPR